MSQKSKIEWCDVSWNPITGCSPVSEGCEHCYARAHARRFNGGDFSVKFHPDRLDQPSKIRKSSRIFVCSNGDLFHKDVTDDQIDLVFTQMLYHPRHQYIILTKRPQRMLDWGQDYGCYFSDGNETFWENVTLGVSAENQARADERIPTLLKTPAAKRCVSLEPLLGPVQFDPRLLNWVIVGAESGVSARPCRLEWVRWLVSGCLHHHVPVFVKPIKKSSKVFDGETRIREWPPDVNVQEMI